MKDLKFLYLDLKFNNIGKDGTVVLANVLGKLTKLEKLYLELGSNNIGKKGCEFLGQNLSNLSNL